MTPLENLAITPPEAGLLVVGGLVAGIVNTLAGGGSLLTVPLLVLVGLPGTLANGTNRLGILVQNGIAAFGFRNEGISGIRLATPILPPLAIGAVAGALVASRLPDALFERLFGGVMVLLLIPTLVRPKPSADAAPRAHSPFVQALVFLAIGFYGGAFQAGVGILLVFALSFAGNDLVRSNAVKVVVNFCFTLLVLPVFILAGQIAWLPACALALGFAAGGFLGARIAVRGGERVIRPVLALAVVALAGRMLGLY